MAAVSKPRPYRRILTSTLHRRFVHASAFALLVCYAISFLIGVKTSFFWSWFPFGPCGIRTLLLFISSVSIFILRVGQLHIGAHTADSQFQSWKQSIFSLNAIQTFGWYFFSSWWFSEVYKWSSSADAQLNWVKPGRHNERAQLNERPIYFHCFFTLLAIVQAVQHLHSDWDELAVPVANRTPQVSNRKTHPIGPLSIRIKKAIPRILSQAAIVASMTAIAGPFVYMLLLRGVAWSWTLYFAKLFWNFPRSAISPPGRIPPLHISLLFRSAVSGALLLVLWHMSNFLFSAFLGQEPLKKGQPLTNGTKDPNGSLINGLKAKKETVTTFAFWELCLISQEFPERRKEIFKDIDREGGAAWTHILKASEEVINGITSRIHEFENPQPASTSKSHSTENSKDAAQTTDTQSSVQSLPRITPSLKEEEIFLASPKPNTRTERFESAFGSVAKSYGQSHDWTPAAQNKASTAFDRVSSGVLSPEQKLRLSNSAQELKLLTGSSSRSGAENNQATPIHPLLQQIMRYPLSIPFRQSYSSRLKRIVLGSPYASLAPIVDATESLTRLLVASLAEDQYGKVQTDVPAVVKLFTQTITTLESFVGENGLKPHWTDVDFPSANASADEKKNARKVEEVETVIATLRNGLAELLAAFKLYLREVGVVGKDLRMAREAAGLVAG